VADNGPGIADADKPRVTERFYRCGTSCATAGIGLGLSLVGAVARLHDGTLNLGDGDPGLIATLKLPAAPAQDEFLRATRTALLDKHTVGMAQA
ncbi:MAG: sensor histidine kinase, partial [Alphaproteobacteria bacterium]|nr:sensor histidine kinase [Alphaproteobacteria bacterium]